MRISPWCSFPELILLLCEQGVDDNLSEAAANGEEQPECHELFGPAVPVHEPLELYGRLCSRHLYDSVKTETLWISLIANVLPISRQSADNCALATEPSNDVGSPMFGPGQNAMKSTTVEQQVSNDKKRRYEQVKQRHNRQKLYSRVKESRN